MVLVIAPGGAFVALGAAHALALPIHREVSGTERAFLLLLPALVWPWRADQVDAVALASSDDVACADVARISQVLGRGQPLGGQRVVDRLGAHRLVHIGWRGLGVHDQPRRRSL